MKGKHSFPLLRSNPSLLGPQPQDSAGGEGGGHAWTSLHSAEQSFPDSQQLFGITHLNKRKAGQHFPIPQSQWASSPCSSENNTHGSWASGIDINIQSATPMKL